MAVVWLASAPGLPAQELQIHHIDVEQGDATLVEFPNGRTLLIDSGLDGRGDEVARFLQSRGISSLNAFLLTHYDSDHMGGIDRTLTEGITVQQWYDRGGWNGPPPASCTSQLCQYQRAAGSATPLWPGMGIDLDSTVAVMVVAANGQVTPPSFLYPSPSEENALSVSLLITYNGFNYFIGGDLTQEVEERLVEQAVIGDIDVYHVNHHGSETSSSAAFLALTRPEVAVISNGNHGGYRHPRLSVLNTLQQVAGIRIYQTNKLLQVGTVGGNTADEFIGDPETINPDGTVTIGVGASTYEVRLPASGSVRQFSIERP